MTTIGRSAARAAWAGDSVVLGAMIVALVPMGVLHLVGSSAVDPVAAPVSDYVAVPGGYTLIGVSAVALAVAGLVLAAGLGASGLPRARTVGGVLVGWSAALMVVAVFPTNVPGTPVTFAAWVHRLGGAVVFGLLPVVVALVARFGAGARHWSAAAGGLRRWAVVSGMGTLVFLAGQLPVGFGLGPALPGIGLVQRLMFAMAMTLLVVLARSAATASVAVASDVPAPLHLGARPECGESA
jgi:hypothetical protein